MKSYSFKISIAILFVVLWQIFLANCLIAPINKKKSNLIGFFILYKLLEPTSNSYARMFFMNPLLLNDTKNISYLIDGTTHPINSKKKLVLIHGWNLSDPTEPSYPSDKIIKERILSQWDHLLNTNQNFLGSVLSKNYDIYFFTYLTSSSIEKNGVLFRNNLDKQFSTQNSNVFIFAHSMGGLVSRIALYQNDLPGYLSKIISSGTPYHGSPWASTVFQKDKSVIGDIANFITNTEGGKNLAWDNFDLSLPGASNYLLEKYNSNTSRDSYINAYYGSIDSNISSYSGSDSTLLIGCTTLGSQYSPSDCIVPQSSASFIGGGNQRIDIGKFQHIDMNLRVPALTTQVLSNLP
jgi:hypothetical protein